MGLEFYGRYANSALDEIVSVVGFSVLALQLWRRCHRRVLDSERFARLKAWFLARRVQIGIDLRGEPELPVRGPGPQALVLFAVITVAWILSQTYPLWSLGVFRMLRGVSGLLATGLQTALWATLLIGIFGAMLLPALLLDGRLRERRVPSRHREVVILYACAVNVVCLLLAGFFLPGWVALVIAFSGVVSGLWLYVPGKPGLRFIWKRGVDASPAAIPAWLWLFSARLFHYGVFFSIGMAAAGASLFSEQTGEDVTSFLGLAFVWSTAGASLVLALRELGHGWMARLRNPARFVPRVVRVHGDLDTTVRERAKRNLEPFGFEVHFGPGPADAEIILGSSSSDAFERVWPLHVTSAELSDPRLHASLRRRADLQARRRLRRGLEKLFRLAKARQHEGSDGIGHWVAPHLWFVVHMGRDGQDEVETIGPPYHSLLPKSSRHHLFNVLQALDVDLIFVEDGVSFRKFQRVLAMVFEYYDMFGERALEERHFQGLPGIRVLLTELEIDQPPSLSTSKYPEPDYEQLGRARILHVFRDRGGEDAEDVTIPDFDCLPIAGLFA